MKSCLLKTVLRSLVKNKLVSIINIIGLSVSFCVAIIIFLYVNREYSYDKFNKNIDQIYLISAIEEGKLEANLSGRIALDLSSNFPEIKRVVRINDVNKTLVTYNPADEKIISVEVNGIKFADSTIFEIFSFDFVYGNSHSILNESSSVIISEKYAHIFFKDKNPIGKVLLFGHDSKPYKIKAVVKQIKNSHISLDIVIVNNDLQVNSNYNDGWMYLTYILCSNKHESEQIEQKINTFYMELNPFKIPISFKIIPLREVYFYDIGRSGKKGNKSYVSLLISMGIFILLLACINFINLSTAQYQQRSKHLGIKKIIGASRHRLIFELLSESTFIALFSLLVGVILVDLVIGSMNRANIIDIQISTVYQFPHLFFIILFSVLLGLLSGLYPSFFFTSINPISVFGKYSPISKRGLYLRRILIVFQFFISIVLIICTITVKSQNQFLLKKELGFQKESVIHVELNPQLKQNLVAFKTKLLQNPNIPEIAYSRHVPGQHTQTNSLEIDHIKRESIKTNAIDPDFIKFYGLQITEGRDLKWETKTDHKIKYIINETAVKYYGLENPIGTKMIHGNRRGEVIGVVKDFHFQSLHHKVEPHLMHWWSDDVQIISIKVNPNNFANTIKYIEEIFNSFSHYYLFEYHFLTNTINQNYSETKRLIDSFWYLTILSIIIACLGLFGLASFLLEQKTKEIGVRKVHGATVLSITFMLLNDFTRLIFLAFVIAFPIGFYFMSEWLGQFAFHIKLDIWIFLYAFLITLSITALTVGYKSVKAAMMNPVDSLKYE